MAMAPLSTTLSWLATMIMIMATIPPCLYYVAKGRAFSAANYALLEIRQQWRLTMQRIEEL